MNNPRLSKVAGTKSIAQPLAVRLVMPSAEHIAAIGNLRAKFVNEGEQDYAESGFDNLFQCAGASEWVSACDKRAHAKGADKRLQYLAFAGDNLVGGAVVRYGNIGAEYGSHIGYAVAPEQRQKGYATQILSAVLAEVRKLADFTELVGRIQLCANAQNIPSIKVIQKNGGIADPSCGGGNARFFIETTATTDQNVTK
jgi:predicted acetyltransferase